MDEGEHASRLAGLRARLAAPLGEASAERHRLAMRTSIRELRTRAPLYALLALPSMALWGDVRLLLASLLLVLVSEAGEAVLLPRLTRAGHVMRERHRVVTYVLSVAGATGYILPGVALAASPSTAVMAAGLVWLLGSVVHVATQYVIVAFLQVSSLAIAAVALAVAVVSIGGTVPRAPTPFEIGVTALFLVAFEGHLALMIAGIRRNEAMRRASEETERARSAAAARDARRDPLTGLLNRRGFMQALDDLLRRPAQDPHGPALLLVDLDGFKPVNDAHGHAAGDAVLRILAQRFGATLRKDAVIGRPGGDEFAVLLPRIATRETAMHIAERLLAAIAEPMEWNGLRLSVGASIGIAFRSGGESDGEMLLAAADRAMYAAKAQEGPSWSVHDPATPGGPGAEERAALEAAIRTGEIRPHYQVKVELATGRVAGLEALARWVRPGGATVLPAGFLPGVAGAGLLGMLTHAMLRQVLSDIRAWRAEGLDPGRVAVNVPEEVLALGSSIDDIEWLLAEHPEAAQHLAVDATEGVVIARGAPAIRGHVRRLSALGVRVAVDDFGTGHASFRHLDHFRFHELKIDGAFVARLGSDPAADLVVAGFLAIARGLGADAVAEGVETPEQAEALRRMHCRFAQGYLFGAPVPASMVRDRLPGALSLPKAG